jgi:hypothetical protein
MPAMSTRRAPALLVALSLALLLASLPGCAGRKKHWLSLEFDEITYANLYLSVIDVLDARGYGVSKRDPSLGQIESDWVYGTSVRQVFGPSRRKAVVEIEQIDSAAGIYEVRVRVREEVIRKAGLRATHLRESDDWEEWEDSFDDAEHLAAMLRALLYDHVISAPQPAEDD